MNTGQYTTTTQSDMYEVWPWYQEYLSLEKSRNPVPQKGKIDAQVALDFCTWVMNTPELRDIVHRRFVKGEYDNATEEMLLSNATRCFLMKGGHSGSPGMLAVCWNLIAKILTGEIADVKSPGFKGELQHYSFAINP